MVKPTSEVHSTAFNVMDFRGKSKSLSKSGGDSQSRTGTAVKSRRILSPLRLPVPPYPRHRSCRYKVERVKGIEPSQPAWKAGTLPLSYTRIIKDSFIWGIWGVGVKDFLWILLPSGIGPSVFVFILCPAVAIAGWALSRIPLNGGMIQPCQQFFRQTHVFRNNHRSA